LHFKDLNVRGGNAHDVPWGTGACNAAGQIAELKRQKFSGIAFIEYEHPTPELMANLRTCVEFFNKAVAE
jgi:sugar phosphate isomerase/epimerase